jgi:hypothetical protein
MHAIRTPPVYSKKALPRIAKVLYTDQHVAHRPARLFLSHIYKIPITLQIKVSKSASAEAKNGHFHGWFVTQCPIRLIVSYFKKGFKLHLYSSFSIVSKRVFSGTSKCPTHKPVLHEPFACPADPQSG